MSQNQIFDRSTLLKILIGSFLGILAIWLAFRGVSFRELGAVLSKANPWLVTFGILIVFLNVAILAFRWWLMLLRDWKTTEYGTLLGGVYLGQMFNILLPARLGELARIFFVSERMEVTKSGLFGSLVLEKVLEVIAFGLAITFLITALALPTWVTEPGQTFLVLALIALLAMAALLLWGRKFLLWATPILGKLPGEWGERVAGILERALTGFDSMRSWKRQLPIWVLTFSSLFLSALTNYLILGAVGIQAPFTAALFVLIVLQVGSAPPSAPGKLGVFHYLAVLALSAFGVEKDLALAYSVVLYVVALLPKILIGVGVLVFSRWRIPELRLKVES